MKDKKADTVIHHFMQNWVTAHGRPKKIWSDVGGEFNNDVMRQLGKEHKSRPEPDMPRG